MKTSSVLFVISVFLVMSCERNSKSDNLIFLLTDDNFKTWSLDSISFGDFAEVLVKVDFCSADDVYTFKANGEMTYDNNDTRITMESSWTGNCEDSTIFTNKTWILKDDFLLIEDIKYEIVKLTDSTMILRNLIGYLPHSKIDPIPIYNYEVYSSLE